MHNQVTMSRSQYRNQNKKKKPLFKKWWFWLLIVILVAAIGTGYYYYQDNNSDTKTESSSKKNKSAKKKSSQVKKASGIRLDNYNGIYLSQTDGLSLASLQKLFGNYSSSSDSTIGDVQATSYTWKKIANGDLGASLIVGFVNDHAISKSISGLKVSRDKKITLDLYNQIQNGQSEQDVINLLGKPNGYSETSVENTASKVYSYTSDVKGDIGANIVITFTDGAVSSKNQLSVQ
ncbi:DUF3862 domain-containing protein [Companilactobacillus jidongensis]|uniref:DUF3862 domain-containing protein n=1 Tax=Companilactobacillus jidongensis TaxID=2486006 RepID=UPI000F7666BB|nr:DUF3862 domain-containing protein [Companilactobacillus jidongensis]